MAAEVKSNVENIVNTGFDSCWGLHTRWGHNDKKCQSLKTLVCMFCMGRYLSKYHPCNAVGCKATIGEY